MWVSLPGSRFARLSKVFRWLKPWLTYWLQLCRSPWASIIQLHFSWIHDTQKLCVYCFRLLKFEGNLLHTNKYQIHTLIIYIITVSGNHKLSPTFSLPVLIFPCKWDRGAECVCQQYWPFPIPTLWNISLGDKSWTQDDPDYNDLESQLDFLRFGGRMGRHNSCKHPDFYLWPMVNDFLFTKPFQMSQTETHLSLFWFP